MGRGAVTGQRRAQKEIGPSKAPRVPNVGGKSPLLGNGDARYPVCHEGNMQSHGKTQSRRSAQARMIGKVLARRDEDSNEVPVAR